jgi:hypothetical protein
MGAQATSHDKIIVNSSPNQQEAQLVVKAETWT